jgi:hypothetical protein
MKNVLLFLFLYPTLIISAQESNKRPVNENKYRINLPDYWGKGNKVWMILTEKLPIVCEELQNKDICGDNCRPKYVLDYYMSEPQIIGYFKNRKPDPVSTNTRAIANSAPGIVQQPGAIAQRPVVNYTAPPTQTSTDTWQLAAEYSFQCFLLLRDENGNLLTKIILVDTNEVWQTELKNIDASQFSPYNIDAYVEKNKENFKPLRTDLFAIVDKKIHAL